MKVAVIGVGHVGLVTAATLASLGHEVGAIDSDKERIDLLTRGQAPFYEPEIQSLLTREMGSGRLRFSSWSADVLPGAEVVFICVGTPASADGEANLLAVERAALEVARAATGSVVVAEKSTVPAGTAERVELTLARERPELEFAVVSNPEFLREGSAVRDSLEPQRILVGSDSERGFEVMRRLYEPLVAEGFPLIETDIRTAELAKHACNAFLALKISYANALARICELAGGDVVAVADVMGSDPRIGRAFLDAGLGYGGYCFPKDLIAFDRLTSKLGYEFPLLGEVRKINDQALDAAVDKVRDAVWNPEGKRIALLGLSFKPGTDDVRLSPALALARRLLELGAVVAGYDPRGSAGAKSELPELEIEPGPYEAAAGAHALVIATDWAEFRDLDLVRLKEVMAYPVIVDGRNLFDPDDVVKAGFTYHPTGRPTVTPGRPEA